MIIYTKDLYHHGVENQEWGVRHGPPYPLVSDMTLDQLSKDKVRMGAAQAATLLLTPAIGLISVNVVRTSRLGSETVNELVEESDKDYERLTKLD